MKSFLALLIGLLTVFEVAAQESIDLLTISGQYGLPQSYQTRLPGKATEYTGLANLKIPIVFSGSTIWYNEFTYTLSYVDNGPVLHNGLADPISLHGFILQTGLVQRIDDSRALQLLIMPRFMTDFHGADAEHWQLGGLALFEKRFHEGLLMRFGAMYNKEFFGHLVEPLVYLDWQLSSRWSISGLLPIYGKLNYQVSDPLAAGLSFFGLNTSYRLGNPAYQGDYIERKSIDLTLFGRCRVAGNFHVEGRVGYALDREYAQYAGDQKMDLRLVLISFGDDRVQKNVNFNDGPIFNLRLVYNLPLDIED